MTRLTFATQVFTVFLFAFVLMALFNIGGLWIIATLRAHEPQTLETHLMMQQAR